MTGRGVTAAAVAALTAACAPPPPTTSAGDLQPAGLGTPALAGVFVGCWALEWERNRSAPAIAWPLPDSVSLRDALVFGTRERLVSPATHPSGRESAPGGARGSWESRYRLNRWWVEGDSLRLRFSDGARDEWHLRLGEDGEGLGGWASSRASAEAGTAPEARVRGSPIGCDFG